MARKALSPSRIRGIMISSICLSVIFPDPTLGICHVENWLGCLVCRTIFKASLKTITDARFGHEEAWAIGIDFDFLPQFANENSQVLDVVSLVAAPNFLEQVVVRHHEADMRRQNME
jgi:hypothetical protein